MAQTYLLNEPLNIVLADNDAEERYFFEKELRIMPTVTNLKTVRNSVELMRYLFQNTDHPPDVLFLDINMAPLNVVECLIQIKGDELLKKVPVIIYSAANGEENVSTYYECGANSFLKKGNYSELTKCLDMVILMQLAILSEKLVA